MAEMSSTLKTLGEMQELLKKLILLRSIDELGLCTRTGNTLRAAQIETIGDLTRLTAEKFCQFRAGGRMGLADIKRQLSKLGLEMTPQ